MLYCTNRLETTNLRLICRVVKDSKLQFSKVSVFSSSCRSSGKTNKNKLNYDLPSKMSCTK